MEKLLWLMWNFFRSLCENLVDFVVKPAFANTQKLKLQSSLKIFFEFHTKLSIIFRVFRFFKYFAFKPFQNHLNNLLMPSQSPRLHMENSTDSLNLSKLFCILPRFVSLSISVYQLPRIINSRPFDTCSNISRKSPVNLYANSFLLSSISGAPKSFSFYCE